MRRSSLIAIGALAGLALFAGPASIAGAAPKTCTTPSSYVVGGQISGKLTSSKVDPVQANFATCASAKKVMRKVAAQGVEEPKSVAGFWCRPTVSSANPNRVSYICTFKGADTATFIKVTFQLTYKPESSY